MLLKYILSAATVFSGVLAAGFPEIQITENGTSKTLYLVSPSDKKLQVKADEVTIPYNYRGYLAINDSLGPNNFYKPNMLNGTIAYDVDLSQAGCSCNTAVYLTKMPARNKSDGEPLPGSDKAYYCDANGAFGEFCPNFDIMEANTYAFQVKPKRCDPPPNIYEVYSKCDGVGQCLQIAEAKLYGKYGPGEKYTINTQKKFRVNVTFTDINGMLSYVITLTQDGKSEYMYSDSGCNGYLKDLRYALGSGLNLVVSVWGGDKKGMEWLNGNMCYQDCTNNPNSTISNITYVPGTGKVPPFPLEWDFGMECSYNYEGMCARPMACRYPKECRWAWPHNDPRGYNSPDAKCRCKPAAPQPDWQEDASQFIQ